MNRLAKVITSTDPTMRSIQVRRPVIHLGDAGIAALKCGAPEVKDPKNWTWKPESVTCKKCLRIYRQGLR